MHDTEKSTFCCYLQWFWELRPLQASVNTYIWNQPKDDNVRTKNRLETIKKR